MALPLRSHTLRGAMCEDIWSPSQNTRGPGYPGYSDQGNIYIYTHMGGGMSMTAQDMACARTALWPVSLSAPLSMSRVNTSLEETKKKRPKKDTFASTCWKTMPCGVRIIIRLFSWNPFFLWRSKYENPYKISVRRLKSPKNFAILRARSTYLNKTHGDSILGLKFWTPGFVGLSFVGIPFH